MVNFFVYIFVAIVLIGLFVFGYAIRHSVQVSEDTPFLYDDFGNYEDMHGDKEEEKVKVVEEKPKKRGSKKKVQKKD